VGGQEIGGCFGQPKSPRVYNRIRAEFDARFTAQHMAQNHLKLYSRLIKARTKKPLVSAESLMAQGSALAAHAAAMAGAPGFNAIA